MVLNKTGFRASIEIEWTAGKYYLLMNVPESREVCYAETVNKQIAEGEL